MALPLQCAMSSRLVLPFVAVAAFFLTAVDGAEPGRTTDNQADRLLVRGDEWHKKAQLAGADDQAAAKMLENAVEQCRQAAQLQPHRYPIHALWAVSLRELA